MNIVGAVDRKPWIPCNWCVKGWSDHQLFSTTRQRQSLGVSRTGRQNSQLNLELWSVLLQPDSIIHDWIHYYNSGHHVWYVLMILRSYIFFLFIRLEQPLQTVTNHWLNFYPKPFPLYFIFMKTKMILAQQQCTHITSQRRQKQWFLDIKKSMVDRIYISPIHASEKVKWK